MSGPVWTQARLQRVMCLRFGFSRAGGVDTRSAAHEMGVSQRTVQRWLHARSGRSLAHIPPARLEQLLELLHADPLTLRREAQNADYARAALGSIGRAGQSAVDPRWEEQGWLQPHLVVILEIGVRQLKVRQVTVCRDADRPVAEVRRRGRVVSQVTVPTRFHATLVSHAVLQMVVDWRFTARRDSHRVRQGFTQAWLADRTTPRIDLSRLAEDVTASLHAEPSLGRDSFSAGEEITDGEAGR